MAPTETGGYNEAVTDAVPGVRLLDVQREDAVGTVMSATLLATGERVAVRRLHGHLCEEESARLIFAEEAKRIATLDHPFLLKVRKADMRAAVPWMLTDPVDGGTLEDEIAKGAWTVSNAKALVWGVLKAFQQLEQRRQFHAAPVPSKIVRVGDGWKLVTFRDVRAEDEAPRMKGRLPDGRWSAPEFSPTHGAVPKARTLSAWAAGALWFGVRTQKAPGEAPIPSERAPTAEGRLLSRLLDKEPLRRPHGAEACLALMMDL